MFDAIYEHLCTNQLLTPNQSVFDQATRQSINSSLLRIKYIVPSNNFLRERKELFLDVPKAFDKVWHDGLRLKLKSYGISGSLFTIIKDFLANCQQRVALNRKSSCWSSITAGAPQSSILGPLFFLIYINDLVDNISSEAKLLADDTFLFTVDFDLDIASNKLNRELDIIYTWAYKWKMQFNLDINKQEIQVIFSQERETPVHPPLGGIGIIRFLSSMCHVMF